MFFETIAAMRALKASTLIQYTREIAVILKGASICCKNLSLKPRDTSFPMLTVLEFGDENGRRTILRTLTMKRSSSRLLSGMRR
jgi:hypothetical protein